MFNKIILGTAQFGANYGINNKIGKIKTGEITKILNFLKKKKIFFLDTANSYKKSELEIGKYIKKDNCKFKIITKYSLKKNKIIDQFYNTRFLTGQIPHTILAHSAKDYMSKNFQRKIIFLKENFPIKNIGVSLYDPEEYFKILKTKVPDVIQVPINLFDKRFLDKKIINSLKKNKIKMHARSVFLQGLFFSNKKKIFKNFTNVKDNYKKILKISKNENISLGHLSFVWAYNKKEISKIVIGVDSLSQLKHNLSCLKRKISYKSIKTLNQINLHNNKIIKPNLWKKKRL